MIDVNGVGLSFGGYVKQSLDDLKDFVINQWDDIILVTGAEGDGKTSFVKLASLYLDHNITEKQWAYTAEQFEQIVDSDLPPMSCIVWDESDELSQHWASKMIQALSRKFKRIRKKRFIIFLITPTFFDMRKYWAITRTRCLYDVYATPERDENGKFLPNRGQVRFFSHDTKRKLYIYGSKEWDMRATSPDWWDRFGKVPDNYPIAEDVLEKRKDEAMKSLIKTEKSHPDPKKQWRQRELYRWAKWFEANPGKIPQASDYGWVYGVHAATIRRDWVEMERFVANNGLQGTFLSHEADTFSALLEEGVSDEVVE